MRTITLTIMFFLTSVYLVAQNLDEVVYLKNGSIIRGIIVEQVPNKTIKVQTKDGSLFVYNFSDVEKITKEPTLNAPISENQQKTKPATTQKIKESIQTVPEQPDKAVVNLPVSYGIQGGIGFANMTNKDNSGNNSTTSKLFPGIILGGYIKYNYKENISFDGGFLFVQKGQKTQYVETYSGGSLTDINKFRLNYIEVPLHIRLTKEAGRFTYYGAVGPYFGLGVGGKITQNSTEVDGGYTTNDNSTTKVIWGNTDDSDVRKLDFGLSLGAGIELGKIELGIEYNFGLANAFPVPTDGEIFKNKFLGISLTYLLK